MKMQTILLAAATALALAPVMGLAQSNTSGADSDAAAEMQAVISDYSSTSQQLQKILKQTVQANPDLAATRKAFKEQVKAAMIAAGYEVESSRARMQEINKKLKSGTLDEAARKELTQELSSRLQRMLKAQHAALQKPDIQAARRELHHKTLAAMRAQDKQTDELLSHMKALRSQWAATLKARQQAKANQENGSTDK